MRKRGRPGHALCLSSHCLIKRIFSRCARSMGTLTRRINTTQIFLAARDSKKGSLRQTSKGSLTMRVHQAGGEIPRGLESLPPIVSHENQISRTSSVTVTPSDPRPLTRLPRADSHAVKVKTSEDEQRLRLNKNRRGTFVVKSLLLSPADGKSEGRGC